MVVGARTRVAAVSVVGGARDRQVSSSAMGDVSDWVLEGGERERGDGVQRGGVHRSSVREWCKQLMDAIGGAGYAKAFPRSKRSPAERASVRRGVRRTKQNVSRERSACRTRVPGDARTRRALGVAPPRWSRRRSLAPSFTALAHASSPRVPRARLGHLRVSRGVRVDVIHRERDAVRVGAPSTLMCGAHGCPPPSLIAWFHHAFHTARRRAYGDIFIHSASSALSALCASSTPRMRRTVRRRRAPRPDPPNHRLVRRRVRHCAWNVGLVHIAVVLTHLSSVFPSRRRPPPRRRSGCTYRKV